MIVKEGGGEREGKNEKREGGRKEGRGEREGKKKRRRRREGRN